MRKSWFLLPLFVFLITPIVINHKIINQTSDYLHQGASKIPVSQVALVPGASVIGGKKPSGVLAERLDSAISLYKANVVAKLLLSGDNSRPYYDEVNVMKNYCLERGVNPKDIFLDHSGLRTLDSIVRAKEVFSVRDMIIVSQDLYLPRALYLAQAESIRSAGLAANRRSIRYSFSAVLREYVARLVAYADVNVLHSRPTFEAEKKIPITGDGQLSWTSP